MPCDQLRTTTLNMQAADLDLLAKALEAEGHRVTGRGQTHISFVTQDGYSASFQGGRISVDERAALAKDPNPVKRAYSREVIKKATSGAGWRTRFTSENEIVAYKRRMN